MSKAGSGISTRQHTKGILWNLQGSTKTFKASVRVEGLSHSTLRERAESHLSGIQTQKGGWICDKGAQELGHSGGG